MKKIALLPISLFAALSITACGDSESGNPVTPEGGSQPALSSEALPGSSDALPTSSATVPGSSETVPPASSAAVPASSATVEAPVEFTTDAVAIPDMGCTSEPLSFGSGVKVTCNGEFVGNIVDDSDPSAFDPNAAAYTSFIGIKKVFAAIQPTDKAVFILRHGDRTKSEEGGLLTGLGYEQAIAVGKKIASTEEVKFWHSEIERTLQTSMGIAQGRGLADRFSDQHFQIRFFQRFCGDPLDIAHRQVQGIFLQEGRGVAERLCMVVIQGNHAEIIPVLIDGGNNGFIVPVTAQAPEVCRRFTEGPEQGRSRVFRFDPVRAGSGGTQYEKGQQGCNDLFHIPILLYFFQGARREMMSGAFCL